MNAIFKRKSIRQFRDKEVEDEKIERMLKAAMQAPSADNLRPWEFLVVKDKAGIDAISKMSRYAAPAGNSVLCIITLVDMDLVKSKNLTDWFAQDMSACSENILLQAVEEGLGAVWLGTCPDMARVEILADYFKIPENILPFSVIAIGYPEEDYQAKDKFEKSRIHYEFY